MRDIVVLLTWVLLSSSCVGRPVPGGSSVAEDGGTEPGADSAEWSCVPLDGGGHRCKRVGGALGLPSGGQRWECQLLRDPSPDGLWDCGGGSWRWSCYGEVAAGAPPPGDGPGGWSCAPAGTYEGRRLYRCEKPLGPEDRPPNTTERPRCKCIAGQVCADCLKGSTVGGTECYIDRLRPDPPAPFPTGDNRCAPGSRRWCSGLQYSGYGWLTCLPDGHWPTVIVNGKAMYDCQAATDQRRPDTLCACYHFYFNPKCCERPDCMVPSGTSGRICPPSPGAPCDYCNPQNSECVGAGARCVISNSMETFCTAACTSDAECPPGRSCMLVKNGYNCVSDDFRCY